jgi:hypothetical protein
MKKRGIVWQTLIPWIIAVVVLILIFLMYKLFGEKGGSALDYFKNLLKFGR